MPEKPRNPNQHSRIKKKNSRQKHALRAKASDAVQGDQCGEDCTLQIRRANLVGQHHQRHVEGLHHRLFEGAITQKKPRWVDSLQAAPNELARWVGEQAGRPKDRASKSRQSSSNPLGEMSQPPGTGENAGRVRVHGRRQSTRKQDDGDAGEIMLDGDDGGEVKCWMIDS